MTSVLTRSDPPLTFFIIPYNTQVNPQILQHHLHRKRLLSYQYPPIHFPRPKNTHLILPVLLFLLPILAIIIRIRIQPPIIIIHPLLSHPPQPLLFPLPPNPHPTHSLHSIPCIRKQLLRNILTNPFPFINQCAELVIPTGTLNA